MHQSSTAKPQSRRLRLAPHVGACALDGQVILLDLRTNRYLGISGMASVALAKCVEGWPTHSAPNAPSSEATHHQATSDQLSRHLIIQGLLTDCQPTDARSVPFSSTLGEPTASLDLGDIAMRTKVGPWHVASFLNCAARTAWWLRRRSLHSIAKVLSGRRESLNMAADELAQMKECAVVYERLRPLLFTAREKCLFDSLALTNFLATESLFPRWVIGVKTAPFGAHSWVQAGTTVLNDQHEFVRRFRPIFVA